MNQKVSPKDKELFNRIDEIAHYIWDPIGVAGIPEARDEYDGYLWPLFARVKTGKEKEIIEYMKWSEEEHMGLKFDEEKAKEAANAMLSWTEFIGEKS